MVGLGCEVFQIARMKELYGLQESDTFRSLTIQDTGGTKKAVEQGVAAIREMLPIANATRRETVPASELMLALQCGGSDGYSGITANPALGAAVDLLVKHGGTAILSETPGDLRRRTSADPARRKPRSRREDRDADQVVGGLHRPQRRRDEQQSLPRQQGRRSHHHSRKVLGAAAKGGTTTLRGVYRYAEPVDRRGFVYMDTPGFDPVSATGQVAGGANVLCFTTGRGSAYGCKPTPSLKLATNSDMYRRMVDDMDINCGDILDGVSIEDKGREIFEHILRTASGERTKSELLGYGDAEFVPWQVGATM